MRLQTVTRTPCDLTDFTAITEVSVGRLTEFLSPWDGHQIEFPRHLHPSLLYSSVSKPHYHNIALCGCINCLIIKML